jgi:hypothetical protein
LGQLIIRRHLRRQFELYSGADNDYHSTEWGLWRLATAIDIKSLLNKNPLVIIASLFCRTDDSGTVYVWEGRYDKIMSPGYHANFGILWKHIDTSGKLSLDYSIITKSIRDDFPGGTVSAGRMGTWIVADAVRPSRVVNL